MLLEDWLDDLCVRFIINLPGDDLSSVERICFQVEEAQWYYEDFIRPLDPALPSLTLRSFCLRIFAHCPLLSAFSEGDHMRAFEEFLTYKKRIPVRGAIMLNHAMDSLVLVKGWKKSANWSFPRGKINKDEDDLICAIREVYEETGYELQEAGMVPENRQVKHITLPLRDQDMRLYVFRDVPMDTHFEPRTRKEISKIQWWRIADLPGFRKKGGQNVENGSINANKFYMVAPFLKDLRKWIIEQKKQDTKRHSSNQYLSATMSHDEFLTEDNSGAESAQEQTQAKTVTPGMDTLEGATAALRSLLKVQPPTQGLQADAIKSPVARDSGSELLAFLQGKGPAFHQPGPSNAIPHTPFENTYQQAPAPRTPQHSHLRPSNLSNMPPPPDFPFQQPQQVPYNSFSYQEPNRSNHSQPDSMAAFQQQQMQNQHQPSHPHHVYQSPHLIHPQPLPPQVQRAVFTGGPVHAPMMPQPVQQHAPHFNNNVSMTVPTPQFSNIHAPMVPSVQKLQPPKLTSHSLALLDAFKSRDQSGGIASTNDLPLRRYELEPKQHQLPPQELPAEMLRPAPVDLLSLFKAKDSPAASPSTFPPPKPISDAHKSTLLGLFKSPMQSTFPAKMVATAPFPAKMVATALPTSVTPSAVELSAAEPLSSMVDKKHANNKGKGVVVSEPKSEANAPFRPVTILSRPQPTAEFSTGEKASETHKPHQNGQNGTKHATERSRPSQTKPSTEKPFQPRILKRPQPNAPKSAAPTASPVLLASLPVKPSPNITKASLSTVSPLSFAPLHLLPTLDTSKMNGQSSASPLSFAPLPTQSSFDRRATQPTDHKQTLLSLFSMAPSPKLPPSRSTSEMISPLQPMDPASSISARSRVGSLAKEVEPRRPSQAPMSPADKNFLLSYLDTVAKGVKR